MGLWVGGVGGRGGLEGQNCVVNNSMRPYPTIKSQSGQGGIPYQVDAVLLRSAKREREN